MAHLHILIGWLIIGTLVILFSDAIKIKIDQMNVFCKGPLFIKLLDREVIIKLFCLVILILIYLTINRLS